jgi:hypothetical protein
MRGKSLLSDESDPCCYVCGTTYNLHVHHVYGGVGRRHVSDREGCWVFLCARHHNMSNAGIHFDKELDDLVKAECQRRWEEREGIDEPNHETFIALMGRNYIL